MMKMISVYSPPSLPRQELRTRRAGKKRGDQPQETFRFDGEFNTPSQAEER